MNKTKQKRKATENKIKISFYKDLICYIWPCCLHICVTAGEGPIEKHENCYDCYEGSGEDVTVWSDLFKRVHAAYTCLLVMLTCVMLWLVGLKQKAYHADSSVISKSSTA